MTEATKPNEAPTTTEERLEALEFLLGQTLLALEEDSNATMVRLDRLELAINRISPSSLPLPGKEETGSPFTVDDLCAWMQKCVEAMRANQSVSARQMVAIGELTMRVASLGEELREPPQPEIGPDARAAVEKARRQRPPG